MEMSHMEIPMKFRAALVSDFDIKSKWGIAAIFQVLFFSFPFLCHPWHVSTRVPAMYSMEIWLVIEASCLPCDTSKKIVLWEPPREAGWE